MAKHLIKLLLFVSCIICFYRTIAQDDYIDSLKKVLVSEKEDTNKVNTLDYLCARYWRMGDYKNAMENARAVLALATKIDFKIGIADGYVYTGLAFNIKKDKFDESESFNKALILYKQSKNKKQIIHCYDWMVEAYKLDDDASKVFDCVYAAQKIREETGDKIMIADGYMNIGWVYHDKKDKFNESEYFNKALTLYKETGNKQQIIDCYDGMREAFFLDVDDAKFFECVFAAQKIREQTGDKKTIADGFLNIASAMGNTGGKDFAAELKNDITALHLYQELGDQKGIGTMSFMIGGVYNNESKYAEALDKYAEALRILKNNGPLNEIANIYALIGSAYEGQGDSAYSKGNILFALGKYHEAEINQFISLKKWQAVPYRLSVANCYSSIGFLNIKLKNLNKAKKYLDSSLIIYQSMGLKGSVGIVYQGFSKIDSIKGNFREAYENLRLYKIYHDSSNHEEDAKKAVQVQMQYDFDKKEAISKAEQDKKDEETKRIKDTQYLVIGSLGILVLAILIIAFIIYRNNRQKQRTNELLETTLANLKSAQSQIIQSEKMASLGELTAGIAHEIQNPLNFVNNFSEVNKELIAELKQEADNKNYDGVKLIADNIENNEDKIIHHGKRADSIVKGMLQHSRSGTGQKELVDINAILDECLRLSYHGLRARDKSFQANLQTDLDDAVDKIPLIQQDIVRVFVNLFNNAFYAVNEKRKGEVQGYEPVVSISTKKIGDKIEIRVKDNGNGMPQKVVAKIFQPFFTTKPTGQGTGLGLSLSYDIVKAHEGEINVNTKEGEFTEFVVQLPVGGK